MSCIESYLRNLYSFDWIGLDMGQLEHRNLASIGTQLPQLTWDGHSLDMPPIASCECNDESEDLSALFSRKPRIDPISQAHL